jgi:5-methylcytosine-specific restriction protein A
MMDRQYNKYERSPDVHRKYGRAWKRIRDRYASEHPLCELCLKEGRLTLMDEVHHILPVSQGGRHNQENLMSLCRSCHTKLHHDLGDR